jgi:hypothetical protein
MQVAWGTGLAQSVTFTKTNTGTWQTADIPVPGLSYTGALGDGADLAISELGGDATNFAMVELTVDGR